MPTTGGCQCGKLRYSFEGEPAMVVLCHCTACKRSTGSTYSTNLVVPTAAFSMAEPPAVWTRVGDSGLPVGNHFCATCGTFLYAKLDVHPGVFYLKSGTLDEHALNDKWKPAAEIYCMRKYGWQGATEGVASFEGTAPAPAS